MKRCRSFSVLILLLAYATIASIVYGAGVPNTLNYQGTLTDSTGKPVTATAKPVTFKLYTSALGGTPFWSEPQTVPITNGQFSAVLGSTVPLPTDKFTGSTYVSVTVDAGQEMLPRQKLTSVAYALKAADAIPKGVIVMWSGAVTAIPEGWVLCDGVERILTDGSKITPPNLKDRFIVGAGALYTVGATGGEATHLLTAAESGTSAHGHSAYSGGQSANHSHAANADGGTSDSNGGYFRLDDGATKTIQTNGASNDHTHGIVVNNSSPANALSAHNNMPPYYALAYIMKL